MLMSRDVETDAGMPIAVAVTIHLTGAIAIYSTGTLAMHFTSLCMSDFETSLLKAFAGYA